MVLFVACVQSEFARSGCSTQEVVDKVHRLFAVGGAGLRCTEQVILATGKIIYTESKMYVKTIADFCVFYFN